MTFSVSNARSVSAKVGSLIDLFDDLDLHFACLSETWLHDNRRLRDNSADIEAAHGISFMCKSRKTRGGGVAIAYKKEKLSLKRFVHQTQHKIVCGVGSTVCNKQKVAIISYYLPPN